MLSFAYECMDDCNSLLIGVTKSRLLPPQLVLNAASRRLAHFPRFSHTSISTLVREHLHWVPLIACVTFKVLFLQKEFLVGLHAIFVTLSVVMFQLPVVDISI